jgi:hypothetical protein
LLHHRARKDPSLTGGLAEGVSERFARDGDSTYSFSPSAVAKNVMTTRSDVRKIALSFSGTKEKEGHFAFEVLNKAKYKGFCWVWMERIDPKKARVPNPEVLAVRVPNLDAKEILLMADRDKFFTEPHYDGFPAVLVRLKEIGRAELRALLAEAWATQAPKPLLAKFRDAGKRK